MSDSSDTERQRALDEVRADARLAPALAQWMEKAAATGLPGTYDIDPLDLPARLLPYLLIIDVDGSRFRHRLVGSGLVRALGFDFTGTYVDEVFSGDQCRATLERYRNAVEKGRPVYGYADYVRSDGLKIRNSLLALPYADDDGTVNRLLVACSPNSEWLARDAARNVDRRLFQPPVRALVIL